MRETLRGALERKGCLPERIDRLSRPTPEDQRWDADQSVDEALEETEEWLHRIAVDPLRAGVHRRCAHDQDPERGDPARGALDHRRCHCDRRDGRPALTVGEIKVFPDREGIPTRISSPRHALKPVSTGMPWS